MRAGPTQCDMHRLLCLIFRTGRTTSILPRRVVSPLVLPPLPPSSPQPPAPSPPLNNSPIHPLARQALAPLPPPSSLMSFPPSSLSPFLPSPFPSLRHTCLPYLPPFRLPSFPSMYSLASNSQRLTPQVGSSASCPLPVYSRVSHSCLSPSLDNLSVHSKKTPSFFPDTNTFHKLLVFSVNKYYPLTNQGKRPSSSSTSSF